MFTRKEILGIGASILVMAGALYLAYHKPESSEMAQKSSTSSTTVYVDTSASSSKNTLEQALVQAMDTSNKQVTKLVVDDVRIGTGTEAVAGKKVTVNYVGQLQNGQEFDSSYKHGQPFTFTLGAGQVIPGWDKGIAGMKVGGKRILIIPPELGYGTQSVGPIPANSTLLFSVELVSVQ